jgi:two-component system response regulator YesN
MKKTLPIRILLVDDDPQMIRIILAMLKKQLPDDVVITTVTCPMQASALVESAVVDLLITDLQMPGLDGLELMRMAKRRNVWTQVLVITGHTNLLALTSVLEAGAVDYLLKPIDPTALREIVQDAVRRIQRWRLALAGTLAARRNVAGSAEVQSAYPEESHPQTCDASVAPNEYVHET